MDFFEGVGFFADGDGDGAEADGTAFVVFSHDANDLLVHFVESTGVDLKQFEGVAVALSRVIVPESRCWAEVAAKVD